MVKNCGSKVHQEVATKDFMDIIRNIALVKLNLNKNKANDSKFKCSKSINKTKPDPVKAKLLELIQCWAHAFKKNPNYRVVEDYFNSMKLEGFCLYLKHLILLQIEF